MASVWPGSPLLSQSWPRDHEPMVSGEYVKILLQSVSPDCPEPELLDLIAAAGGGRYRELADFFAGLHPPTHLPNQFFLRLTRGLSERGLLSDQAGRRLLSQSRHSPLFFSIFLAILAACARQPWSAWPLDLVSCAFLAQKDIAPLLMNSVLLDANLEEKNGPERRARLFILLLGPDQINAETGDHFRQGLRFLPLAFGEPPARLEEGGHAELYYQAPDSDAIVPLSVRPSLRELARRHGLELKVAGGLVYLNGHRAAVADSYPQRIVAGDLYQMLVDVEDRRGRIAIGAGPRQFRRSEDFLLLQGHRYGLDHSVLYRDYFFRYRVRPVTHLTWALGLKFASFVWEQIGRRFILHPGKLGFFAETLAVIARGQQPPNLLPSDRSDPARAMLARQAGARFQLTAREGEILNLILQGRSSREIAEEVEIEPATVKTHIRNLLAKAGMKNRRTLIASLLGTLPLDDEDDI
jgi:DNA-binding CsgD family transcriptional regulator